MRKVIIILLFAVLGLAGLALQNPVANGQEKMAAAGKPARWEGHIVRVDKDAMTMEVRNSHGIVKKIHWDSSTAWSKLNKPVTDQSEFKEPARVICVGTYDDKGTFNATRIDLRVHQ